MTRITAGPFFAEVPRQDDRNLGDQFASESVNVDTSRGLVEPYRKVSTTYTSMTDAIQTIYHLERGQNTYWLTWPVVVDVARSPIAQDSQGRLYLTGDGEPRMTTYSDAISGPGPYPFKVFVLGVPSPKTAPTISAPAGGTTVSRAYVYTLKTPLGEESGPSPATIASGDDGGTWNLSGLDTPPPNSGSITSWSVSGNVATLTLPSTFGLFAGEEMSVSGTGSDAVNGKKVLKSVGASTITFDVVTPNATGSGGTWARVAEHNTTGMVRCIYRTTGTDTAYRRSAGMVITDPAQTTYADSTASTALAITLDSLEANTPPKNGHSLVVLPNSSMAMLAGNELCFSEIGKPHSYPTRLRYAMSADGVALAVAGMGVIVLTDEDVRYYSAPTPDSAAPDPIGSQRCVAKRAVAQVDGGCVFPSIDGWYLATPSGVTPLSAPVFRIQEWNKLQPSSMVAVVHNGIYACSYQDEEGNRKMLRFNLADKNAIENVDVQPDALHVSRIDGRLYLAKGRDVQLWGNDQASFMTCSWVSKLWQFPAPVNMAVAKVDGAFDEIASTQVLVDLSANEIILSRPWSASGYLGGAPIGSLAVGCSRLRRVDADAVPQVVFSVIHQDGTILYSTRVLSDEPFRLPGGFKESSYYFGMSTNIPVSSFSVATSLRELKGRM